MNQREKFKNKQNCIQAGTELGQAQLKLKLSCTTFRICFIKLMIAVNHYMSMISQY